ncbi:MAG: cell filamentation protein Fic [Acidobacteria bacterium RIFCSPLOWO2_12_FULL_67_14b]|nr:MAG: cell filamentation protein Fic [Acidobacteria bacterium RIFCSPLOWO2_12_FULL_67_14b]
MPAPHEKLAESLIALQALQKSGRRVIQSDELSRVHRERLLENGFLREVMKGWLISSSPGARDGDSTPWYASFWEFCARYCDQRFGDAWHLSPQQSLLLLAENTVIPKQVVVYSPKGGNHNLDLLFGTSLYDLKSDMPDAAALTERNGLRLFSPPATLVRMPKSSFGRQPIETQVVLAGLRDASDLLRILLAGGNSAKAGVLAGALRRIGRPELADEILKVMSAAGYDARESDPFEAAQAFSALPPAVTPIVGRMRAMWRSMRNVVVENFPAAPGLPQDKGAYLGFVDDIYKSDAYHSLSIEGYSVTPELIARVQQGDWNPEHHDDDRKSRDALAARGYWQAFQRVKETLSEIISGANPGARARATHMDWYRELFQPCVAAGIIPATALAGYRNDAVYLRTSRYVPPRWEAVRDAMPELFDLLENETHPGVRAVLGHWLFGYIHPYPDGNGRMARFVMNAMLASGGYPWTVILKEDRDAYLSALDRASIDMDIAPFTTFVAERVRWSLQHSGPKA